MQDREHLFSTGELARMAGVSVRTLQYYDAENLLKPFVTEGGRRRYTSDHVLRLEQIIFLKSIGFSLEEIKNIILSLKSTSDFNQAFLKQRDALTKQVSSLTHTIEMLDAALEETKDGKDMKLDRLIMVMESMKRGKPYTFIVRYFDDDQLKNYAVRMLDGSDHTDSNKDIFEQLEKLYGQGADPNGREGQELAKRWWSMVRQFTGGNFKLIRSLMYVGEDIRNWPEEAEPLKKPIQDFLAEAFNTYLENNGIKIQVEDNDPSEKPDLK